LCPAIVGNNIDGEHSRYTVVFYLEEVKREKEKVEDSVRKESRF
jgi:hypothetical protein